MDLAALKTALKTYGFSDSDPLETWLNAAMHELEDESNWPFLQKLSTTVTVAMNDTVLLASDVAKLHTLRIITESEPLIYVPRATWEDDVEDPTEVGVPSHYTLLGMRTALLYRVPDSVYSLRYTYKAREADLAAGGPVLIPAAHHYTIVYKAAVIGLETEEDAGDQVQSVRDSYQGDLSRMMGLYTGQQTSQVDQVRDVMDYG